MWSWNYAFMNKWSWRVCRQATWIRKYNIYHLRKATPLLFLVWDPFSRLLDSSWQSRSSTPKRSWNNPSIIQSQPETQQRWTRCVSFWFSFRCSSAWQEKHSPWPPELRGKTLPVLFVVDTRPWFPLNVANSPTCYPIVPLPGMAGGVVLPSRLVPWQEVSRWQSVNHYQWRVAWRCTNTHFQQGRFKLVCVCVSLSLLRCLSTRSCLTWIFRFLSVH